jgi:isopentenyl-diphosphate Delta-isomerase
MSEEHFETFDRDGRSTGLAPRSRVHREGLWHRSVNVFLFRSDGQLLLQRRHPDKDVWPGAWDLSVAEHLKPGEAYLDAALRGLSEELGIVGVALEPLGGVVASRVVEEHAGVQDCELQQAYRLVYDGPVSPDPAEVTETAEFPVEELARAFARRPGDFTPWFRESVERLELFGAGAGRVGSGHDR